MLFLPGRRIGSKKCLTTITPHIRGDKSYRARSPCDGQGVILWRDWEFSYCSACKRGARWIYPMHSSSYDLSLRFRGDKNIAGRCLAATSFRRSSAPLAAQTLQPEHRTGVSAVDSVGAQGCGDNRRSCASMRSRHSHILVKYRSTRMCSIAVRAVC